MKVRTDLKSGNLLEESRAQTADMIKGAGQFAAQAANNVQQFLVSGWENAKKLFPI